MDSLEQLRAFLVLARTLHFGRASEQHHVSPSTLSRSIARLEEQVGARLFERDRRHVALTQQGLRFQRFAEDTLEAWDRVQGDIRVAGSIEGSLSIFCTVTASQSVLPDMLARFRERYPAVHIELETGYAGDALAMLERAEVDVSIAALPDRLPSSVVAHTLVVTPLAFVAPVRASDAAAATRQRDIAWDEVPLILPPTGIARDAVERWFRAKRMKPVITSEIASHEAILSLVALGVGVGVVPRLVLEKSALQQDVRVVAVKPRLPSLRVAVCVRRRSLATPLVGAFWTSVTVG